MNVPRPADESERLHTIRSYGILDTLPEAAFDRITTLAAQLFHVPIALVSFVDAERQWFKACFGIDTRQTSREVSFCTYVILSDSVLVVPDALADSRFADNALVTGPPHIRFYAGAPLRTPDGVNLGSFCILDTNPRQLGEDQKAMLANLADMVVDELELRRTARELQESENALRVTLRENSQLAVAVNSLNSGVVISDPNLPNTPITFVNTGFCAMTGYAAQEAIGQSSLFLTGPQTDPAMLYAIRQALAERRAFKGVILNYRKDGTPFQNEISISPVWDETGQFLTFVELQNDVTEREQAHHLLEDRVQKRTAELAHSQIEILSRLARAAEYRDDATGQHTQRVARTAALLSKLLGLPPEQVDSLCQAAPLHDVGKIAISDSILLKPGKLTDEEFTIMKTHSAIGASMLSDGHSEVVQMAERIAASHHERWDGKGYPRQLAGENIPIEGRILAVADVFDALTHERPYKKAWSVARTVAEIAAESGKHFDPQVVKAFLQLPHEDLI